MIGVPMNSPVHDFSGAAAKKISDDVIAERRRKNTEKCRRKRERRKARDPIGFAAAAKVKQDRLTRWRKANPEKYKAERKRSNERNREAIKAWKVRRRQWELAGRMWWVWTHPEEIEQWKAEKEAARRVLRKNRKLRKKGVRGWLSSGVIGRLMLLQKGCCGVCKVKQSVKMHMDHIVPLKLGGTNDDRNVQLLCADCNMAKSAKHPVEFMQSRGMLL